MSFRLGLTGSIGMGKSTTAKLFAKQGCAVWDADAAVHRLYVKGGTAVAPMQAAFPSAIVDGAVSRDVLKKLIGENSQVLKQIEQIVHPLLAKDRSDFVDSVTSDILVFDIPLLFETGGNTRMDAVVCVSIPAEIQKIRVMERGTMTEAQFEHIRSKQMPNDQKCALSDFVVETDTVEHASLQVTAIISAIRERLEHA